MEYINFIKAKAHLATSQTSEKPVLSEEDEQFLNRITSDDGPRPLSSSTSGQKLDHGGDAQIALMGGAQNIALPAVTEDELLEEVKKDVGLSVSASATQNQSQSQSQSQSSPPHTHGSASQKARSTWTWLRRDSRDRHRAKHEAQTLTADGLHEIAQGLKSPDAKPNEDHQVTDEEAKKEEEDMTVVLEGLNLAAVNNRVFSISDETQQLLEQFNQVFKDLIKGVPTAYGDLESLLTNGDQQLQKTYSSLPPFLQKLIEKLPETMTKGFAPEMMAVAAERAGRAGYNMEHAGKAASIASKVFKTPSLKDLVAKPSAIATMLKSILNFLKARFPAFMGMNVLWSLAMFVLLFVFWYCYKRGKEVRLEKERELTEQELSRLDVAWRAEHPGAPTTTAPPGASAEDVLAGIQEVQAARALQEAATDSSASQPTSQNATSPGDKVPTTTGETRSTGHE